jgi:structural maintenance of chromosome 4
MKRAKDLEETTAARDSQKLLYDRLRKQRLDEFMTGFSAISLKLKEMYQVHTAVLQLIGFVDISGR